MSVRYKATPIPSPSPPLYTHPGMESSHRQVDKWGGGSLKAGYQRTGQRGGPKRGEGQCGTSPQPSPSTALPWEENGVCVSLSFL